MGYLRLLLALAVPHTGRVTIGGADLAELDADAWRHNVAFLPQRPYLPLGADLRSTVRLLVPAASDARIRESLELVGLMGPLQRVAPDPLSVRVHTLSVGQRQRVALARMLCRDASLFVLDEPDANLDRAGIALVAGLVRTLSRTHKILIAAHTPELVALADRVIELHRGRIVRDEQQRVA